MFILVIVSLSVNLLKDNLVNSKFRWKNGYNPNLINKLHRHIINRNNKTILLFCFWNFPWAIFGKFHLSSKLYCLIHIQLVSFLHFGNNVGWLTSLSLAKAVFPSHPCLLRLKVLCAPCCCLLYTSRCV